MKKLALALLSVAIVAGIVWAAVPNGPQPAVGLYWYTNSDPTVGGGVAAPLAQLLIRQDVPSIYFKSGSANTAWTKIGSGAGGGAGTVTSLTCSTGLLCTPNPITTTGTETLNINGGTTQTCPGGQAVTSESGVGIVGCSAFPTGTGTTGDLTAWASSSSIGNYAGSSCAGGNAATALSAAGALTCTSITPGGSISGTNNTIAKFSSSTTVGNSSVTDNTVTVQTAEAVNVGAFTDIGQLSISGSIAPTSFTGARVDNYAPTGLATTYVIDQVVTSATPITGLAAQVTGTQIDFRNSSTSTGALTFSNADTNSTLGNRFALPGAVNWIVPPGSSLILRYTGSDWRVLATSTTELPSIVVDGNGAVVGSLTADGGLRVFDALGSGCGAGTAVTALTSSANTVSLTCAAFGTGTVTSATLVSTHVVTASGASAIQDAAGGATDDGTTFTIPDILATNVVDIAVSTPTGITGTVNDYAPSTGNTSEVYEISSSSGIVTLTGLSIGQTKGRRVTLRNVGGQAINLSNKTGSTAANQFGLVGATSWALTAGQLSSITFYYDGSFWEQIGTETLPGLTVTNNASIGGTSTLTGAVTLSNTSTYSGATSHIKSTSTSPALSAGCGTGATITGGDISGTVVENSTAFSAPCTLTFASTFTTAPTCAVTPRGIQVAFSYVPAATTLAVTNTSAETFDYICIGH